jgi:hypothetical protein
MAFLAHFYQILLRNDIGVHSVCRDNKNLLERIIK